MTPQQTVRSTIKTHALRKLGVLGSGDTASGADDALADGTLDMLVDQLDQSGVTRFDKSTLPEAARHSLIALLADALSADYGLPPARSQELSQRAEFARRSLRAAAQSPTHDGISVVNF